MQDCKTLFTCYLKKKLYGWLLKNWFKGKMLH